MPKKEDHGGEVPLNHDEVFLGIKPSRLRSPCSSKPPPPSSQ
jgi:hypothetical protein